MENSKQEYVTAAGYMFDRIYPMFQEALDVENGAYYGLMKKTKMKVAISTYDRILNMANSPYNIIKDLHVRNSDGFEEKVESMYSELICTISKRKEALQCLLTGKNVIYLDEINKESKRHLETFQFISDQVLSMIQKH